MKPKSEEEMPTDLNQISILKRYYQKQRKNIEKSLAINRRNFQETMIRKTIMESHTKYTIHDWWFCQTDDLSPQANTKWEKLKYKIFPPNLSKYQETIETLKRVLKDYPPETQKLWKNSLPNLF